MTRPALRGFVAIIWGVWAAALLAQPASQTPVSLDALVAQGRQLENQQRWQQAADLYDRALRLHGESADLRQRWRTAEQHYSLTRRYHDDSYTSELLNLSEDKALALYQEVVRKIQNYYVDNVDIDELVRAGYRNLNLALTQPVFLDQNLKPGVAGDLGDLRRQLTERTRAPITTLAGAVEEVREAQRLCGDALSSPVAITLEFLTAACECLDPYSAHLTPNRLRDLYALIDGNFVGLGVEVRGDKEGLRILSVLADSPAAEAGVKDGELILLVDRQSLAGMPAEEAANTLQGKIGEQVRLHLRSANGVAKTVTLTRREVVVHSITRRVLLGAKNNVGYLRLASFQKLTVSELDKAVSDLKRQGMEMMVLDLRGNPGGLLDVSVQVANRFIPAGTVVSTRGRAWGQSWNHEARPTIAWSFPMVVLVDGDSASASEILAGALKDHHRAIIIGARTYGKGSVQSIFPLQSVNTGLRLTTARFFSPKGRGYERQGVEPDVVVRRPTDGALGEEAPVPKQPTLDNDRQLRVAVQFLLDPTSISRSTEVVRPGFRAAVTKR